MNRTYDVMIHPFNEFIIPSIIIGYIFRIISDNFLYNLEIL